MVNKVNKGMLADKVVQDVVLSGDTVLFSCTDGTSISLDMARMPVLASIATMLSQLAAINAYIAAHP